MGAAMTLGWVGVLKCANARLERRVAERTEELARSEERFRNLAACLPVGVVETDARGLCTYMNPRGIGNPGPISGRAIGLGLERGAFIRMTRAEVSRSWSEAAAAGKAGPRSSACCGRTAKPAGSIVWPRRAWTDLGRIAGYVATFADITQRKQSEAELEEAHKELVLSSRLAGMAEVATSVLHNVGNVLTSVNISSSLHHGPASAIPRWQAWARPPRWSSDHADDLPAFFASDPKGKQLPGYLSAMTESAHQGPRAKCWRNWNC